MSVSLITGYTRKRVDNKKEEVHHVKEEDVAHLALMHVKSSYVGEQD